MKTRLSILFIFFSIIAYSQVDCNKYKRKYVPINLMDAVYYLDCKWSKKDKNEFKNKQENSAVWDLHMGTGLGIRNSWGLWDGDNEICMFFKSYQINHPDDISSIILTSFHRHLNNLNINFEKQVEFCVN